jgi:hypothetical protein
MRKHLQLGLTCVFAVLGAGWLAVPTLLLATGRQPLSKAVQGPPPGPRQPRAGVLRPARASGGRLRGLRPG